MAAAGDDVTAFYPQLAAKLRCKLPQHCAALDYLRQAYSAKPGGRNDLLRPLLCAGVQQLRGGGYAGLGAPLAAEQEVKVIRHKQQLIGGLYPVILRPHKAHQLKQGVYLHYLNAGELIELFAAHSLFRQALCHSGGSPVTVVNRACCQLTAVGYYGEIHAPGVDGDALDIMISCRRQTSFQVVIQPEDIPIQPASQPDGGIIKPCKLGEGYPAVIQHGKYASAGGGAVVHRQYFF